MASIHKNALPIPGWPIGRRTACPAAAPLATYTRSGRKRLAGRWNCVPTDEGGQVGWRGTPASLSPSPPPKNADESVTLQRRQSGRGAQNMDRYHIRSTAPKQMSPGPASAELGPQHQHRQLQPLRYPTSTTVAASPLPQQPHSARSAGVERRAPFARVPDSGSGGSSPLQAIADPHSELGCARFGLCSGCSLQDGLAAPPLYGEAKEFFQQLGLAEVPAVMYAARGWRCRAKLAVRGSAGRPLIGLFKEGSHDCVDIVDPAFQPPCGTGPAIVDTGRRRGGRSDGGFMAAAGSNSARDNNGGDNGGHLGWMGGDEAFSCRAHHPRINQAAVLIKELVTRLRIPPYNEPALAKARGGAAAAAANHQPPSARASRRQRRQRPLEGPGLPHPGGPNQETGPSATAEGILRYLQLTAVPSQPGNRAEEDPDAAVQVVLVLNLPAKCERNDPRVTSVLRLCRTLWHLAGPGGPMVPATDSPQPPLQSPSPSRSLSASSRYKAPVRAGDWAVWGAEDKRAPRPQKAVASLALSPRMGPDTPPLSNTPLVHSIWLNFQPDAQRNTVLGEGWSHVAGPAAAWQDFGGVAACVGPGSFVQANYGAMQLVLEEIASLVPYGSRVTELHAGIGVIGLSLAARRQVAALRCVEVNPAAVEPFRASLELLRNRQQLPPVVEYLTAEAGSDPERFLADCNVVVVDPPRKGLGQSLLKALTQPPPTLTAAVPPTSSFTDSMFAAAAAAPDHTSDAMDSRLGTLILPKEEEALTAQPDPGGAREASTTAKQGLPSRLVYLSCGFRALQGDLAVLLAGGWRLRSATAYMFFPGTNSLETLVLLTREVNEDGDGG